MDSISTATFRLTCLLLSTKLFCKPYFSDDKCKDSDDKFKTRMLYLFLGNLLSLIFKLRSFSFLKISCFMFSCRNAVNTLKQISLKKCCLKYCEVLLLTLNVPPTIFLNENGDLSDEKVIAFFSSECWSFKSMN